MYIMTEKCRGIINSEFVERFCVVEKEDAVCQLESKDCKKTVFSFVRFLGQIQEVINHYLERLEALKDGKGD